MIPVLFTDVMTATLSGVRAGWHLGKAYLTCYCIRHAETLSKNDQE
jgi:hypothetical protein